jgi:3-oxoacyl-[acyl-carrier protein] reductase
MNALEGKVAIVTGSSQGIGAGIAKEFAAEGASVVVNYASSKAGADATVDAINKEGGKAIAVQADVSKKDDVERMFAASVEAFGAVDILVNNAAHFVFKPVEEVDEEDFLRHFTTNVYGDILTVQQAIKQFGDVRQGGKGGVIINLTSLGATNPPMNSAVYSSTKGAINSLTLELARELGSRGIRINALSSGATITEGAAGLGVYEGSPYAAEFEALTPLGRLGTPEDLAKAAVFLASDQSRWITGDVLKASGGMI